MLQRLRKAFRRARLRLAYREEVTHLRRELIVVYQRMQATEELFIAKQQKINRLLTHLKALNTGIADPKNPVIRPEDLRGETVILSFDAMLKQLAEDFEQRQAEYEASGNRDRQERVTTLQTPPDDQAPPQG